MAFYYRKKEVGWSLPWGPLFSF